LLAPETNLKKSYNKKIL